MDAIFLVPKDYQMTGGMYMPINHYIEYFNNNGMTVNEIIEVPYHKNSTCKEIRERLDRKLSEGEHVIIGFTLNICFLMLKEFQLHKRSNCDCTCFLVDSMALNMDSVIKNEKFGKEYIKHKIKLLLYYFKERYCIRNCYKIVYVSSVDRSYALNLYNRDILGEIYVVPNGIDLPKEVGDKEFRSADNTLVLGTLTGFSQETLNNNLYPFLYSIFPQIIKVFPNVRFVIAGRGASKDIEDKLSELKNVEFIGEVEDLYDFYNEVDAVVTTVKKDCGIINRVLEAWAFRKLNIGFSKNFAAFEYAQKDVHYLVADNAEEFIQIIKKLFNTPEIKEMIEDNGNELVKNHYSWNKSGFDLLNIVEGEAFDKNPN